MILPEPLQQVDRTWVNWRGQTLAYFAGCDYFRLATNPRVLAAAESTLRIFGLNVSASRRTTGNHAFYEELESALADFFEVESALLVSNGYLTNLVVAQGMTGKFSEVFIDEKAHSSLADAALSAGVAVTTFAHRNVDDLQKKLGKSSRPLVMTDGMFAQDGALAPLDKYLEILPESGSLLIDDSHAAGVLGRNGRGTIEHFGLKREQVIQTTTLSKAFGVYGGAILGSTELCWKIVERSRAFGGATPFPLPCVSAALEAVRLLDGPHFRERLRENCARVEVGPGPILAVVPRDGAHEERIRCALLSRGIFPPHIRYQGGPEQGYFRLAISSEHTRAQLDALNEALTAAK